MFSHASVILFTVGLMDTRYYNSLLRHGRYYNFWWPYHNISFYPIRRIGPRTFEKTQVTQQLSGSYHWSINCINPSRTLRTEAPVSQTMFTSCLYLWDLICLHCVSCPSATNMVVYAKQWIKGSSASFIWKNMDFSHFEFRIWLIRLGLSFQKHSNRLPTDS